MQTPTCVNTRIRSTKDAHLVFRAVQLGILPMVRRRLDAEERLALRSGCVYVWEERGPNAEITGLGIERFTEGKRWSQSRVRDEFLFYYERYMPPPDVVLACHGDEPPQPPADWDPLVKQTYSVWVDFDKGEHRRRKWHLTAYFTQASVDSLNTVHDMPQVSSLEVRVGHFVSTRTSNKRQKHEEATRGRASAHEGSSARPGPATRAPTSTVPRTYAAFPPAYSASKPVAAAPGSHHASAPAHTAPHAPAPAPLKSSISAPAPVLAPAPPPAYLAPVPPPAPYGPYTAYAPSPTQYPRYPPPYPPHSYYQQPPAYGYPRRLSVESGSASASASSDSPRLPPSPSSSSSAGSSGSGSHSRSHPRSVGRVAGDFSSISLQPEPGTPAPPAGSADGPAPLLRSPAVFPPAPGYAPPAIHQSPSGGPHLSRSHASASSENGAPPRREAHSRARSSADGAYRVDLAPLHTLQRAHPYRRDPVDDRALRMLEVGLRPALV